MRLLATRSPAADGGTGGAVRKSYFRATAVGALLLAMYLLLRWAPLGGIEAGGSLAVNFALIWCLGGLLTLCFLAIASRKRKRS